MKTALVAGASGLTGRQLVYRLLDSPDYGRVIILVRKELVITSPKLQQVLSDFDHLEQVADKMACDEVFCCLGTTIRKAGSESNFRKVDYGYVYKLARLTHAAGARRFYLISAVGANPVSSFFYLRVKGEAEESTKHVGFDTVCIFRPALLLGKRNELRIREGFAKFVLGPLTKLMQGPLKKYRPIPADTLAQAMMQAARQNEKGIRVFENRDIVDMAD